jgi:hypothetical protein
MTIDCFPPASAPFSYARPFSVDGVTAVRSPVDVLLPGAWSRAAHAAGGDPADPGQRANAYQLALAERCPTVPIAISPDRGGVLTFSAYSEQVDLVAEGGAVVAELVWLTPTASAPPADG